MKEVMGGVCAAKGFKAAGEHCGIRKNKTKRDVALIVSETRAAAAGVYTTNLLKGAPLLVTKDNISDGYAQAVICNSGNANTCNVDGVEVAEKTCELVAKATGLNVKDVIVASTGVIGLPLSIEPFETNMDMLVSKLSTDGGKNAANAILTTDTFRKEIAYSFEIDGKVCTIGGIAKGSGMIHPNMATMLSFITTDAAISPEMLQKALSADIQDTFNMVSVDGDTSTNDMVCILANGMAENKMIDAENADYAIFREALNAVTSFLCREIAKDGEGATKLITCIAKNAADIKTAKTVAKAVICSNLFKAAIFGEDANWGRAMCAVGYSGADIDIDKIDLDFSSKAGEIAMCRNGKVVEFSEEKAKKVLMENEITVVVDLRMGDCEATAWGCDLTYDYVKINGDYRT